MMIDSLDMRDPAQNRDQFYRFSPIRIPAAFRVAIVGTMARCK
jgi:hypothetical protein